MYYSEVWWCGVCPSVAGMSKTRSYIRGDSCCHSLESLWSGNSSVREEMQAGEVGQVYRKKSLQELLRTSWKTQRGDQSVSSSPRVGGNGRNMKGVRIEGQSWGGDLVNVCIASIGIDLYPQNLYKKVRHGGRSLKSLALTGQPA